METETALQVHYSKQIDAVLILLFLLLFLFLPGFGIIYAYLYDNLHLEQPGFINTFSFVVFILLSIISFSSKKVFYSLLPFIIIAFPAAVNDFFPAIYIGTPSELGAATFPFFTHIDIFLLLGIVGNTHALRRIKLNFPILFLPVMILFLLSSAVNFIASTDSHTKSLIIQGLYPVRYSLLLVLLISNVDIAKYEKQIIYSLVFSVFFLMFESVVNTLVTDSENLVSGSLGINTFANVMGAMLIFFIYLRRNKFHFPLFIFPLVFLACCIIILLTGTRIAIIAAIMSFSIIQIYHFNLGRSIIVLIATSLVVSVVYISIDIPPRYSLAYLSSKIKFNGWSLNPAEMITVERSEETSSIYSRIKLYETAYNMIAENPIMGTGYGTFDYLKNEYGFDERVLIDAHNGYLNTLSQLGLSSIFLLYLFYFYPFINSNPKRAGTFLCYLFIINFTMAISDISNAGIYKHSVFALMAFNVIVTHKLREQGKC